MSVPTGQESAGPETGPVAHAAAVAASGNAPGDARLARHLSLLNSLLMVSLDELALERQLLCALDVLLTVPWFSLRSQGAVFLIDDDPDALVLAASRGLSAAECAACARVPIVEGGRDAAKRAREPAVHALRDHGGELRIDGLAPPGYFSIPLNQNGRALGVMTLYPEAGHGQRGSEAGVLAAAASILAGMVARSRDTEHIQRLLDENRQLNRRLIAQQEEEYRRLARELHDDVGQSVAVIKTEVALLPPSPELERGARAIGAEADRIYETMHEIVRRLRPGALDDFGLVAAIENHVADWQRRRPTLVCRVDVAGRFDDLDEPVKVTVYRLVQECLTNVVRHAAATEVRIVLTREPAAGTGRSRGGVVLAVHDNGRGMDVNRLRERTGRYGLLGMRERVEGLGGRLSIESGPGQGFRLIAGVPIAERRRSQGG